jgi:O-antigen ligase
MSAVARTDFAVARSARGAPQESATTAWEWVLVGVIVLVWSTTVVVDFRVALTLLMAVGFVVAGLGLRYARLGVLGIGMLCTLNEIAAPLLLSGGLWRWNTLSYWLLLVALLFFPYVLALGQLQSRILLPFIVLLALEILLSPDALDGIQHVFAIAAVFGLLVYFRRAALDRKAWYWFGVVSGVLAGGGGAAFLLQQGSLPYVNPNVWSYMPLTALIAICLASVAEDDSRRRSVLAGLAAINSVWVFLSGSRGSLLIAAVCLVFLLVLMRLRRAILFGIIAGLVGVVLTSQFARLEQRTVARVRLLADPSQSPTRRTSGRFDLALGAWYMFRDNPFGVGTGGFKYTWLNLGPREGITQFHRSEKMAAHAGWTKVLAENGFPGILLLAAYVASFAVSGWRSRDPGLLRLGFLVLAVLSVAWLSTEFQNKALWLLAAGATVLLERNAMWPSRRLGALTGG